MDKTKRLTNAAERLFDRNGYVATGMDQLTQAAEMSTRTLYKHASSKAQLMAMVLTERDRRFMELLKVDTVDTLFAALEHWIRDESNRGCLFLRAQAETGGDVPEIAEIVCKHKSSFRDHIHKVVATDLGRSNPELADQVLVLLEGATHVAVYRGEAAVVAARAAATTLLAGARS